MATIIDRYEDEPTFAAFLNVIGLNERQIQRLIDDGFHTMRSLVEHYKVPGPKQFEVHLKDLNKTFATASTLNLRIYYSPGVINRLVGCLNYFRHLIYTFHSIIDINDIDMDSVNMMADLWIEHEAEWKKSSDDHDEEEVEIPKLKGHLNWVAFRDAFLYKLRVMKSTRGCSMEYLLDDTPRVVQRSNANLIELQDFLDLKNSNTFKEKSVHFGDSFKSDNMKLWNLLEGLVINTDPFNHIASCGRSKNGRQAWNLLKQQYEGDNAKQRIRTFAMDKLKSTKYYGDTKYFNFEKYINAHVKAHKQLDGKGLDDETKIFYFKEGIEPRADLETALTLGRVKESGTFSEYVIFMSTEVDSKNRRKRQTSKNEKRVSQLRKSGNNGKKSNSTDLGPILHEIVEGKRVESKHYPKNEFAALTPNQRKAVVRLNRERRNRVKNKNNKSSNRVSSLSVEDRDQIADDMITVGNAIVAAVNKARNEQPDDATEITADSQFENTNKKRSAESGSVGDFFAAARKRSKSNL